MLQLLGEQITLVELVGTIFGIAGVWLTVKEKILCFPVGLVNVSLYAWLFLKSGLYSDAALQLVYILLLFYGWYQWTRGRKGDHQLPVSKTSSKTFVYLIVIGVLSTITAGTLWKQYTNASLPYIDSLTTSMSLIAQWMVARKKIENWVVWILADIIYVAMYIYKQLYLTSLLYFIFIILAVIGLQQWKKELELAANKTEY